MTEIRFYHLQRSSIKQSLPGILEKALDRGMRALVYLPNQAHVKKMDDWLWSYKETSFLPHGCDGDDHPEEHPIWITCQQENTNKADLLIVADALPWQGDMSKIVLRCEFFDGGNDEILAKARQNWQKFKEEGHDLSYWQQDDQSRWQQKL